MHRALKAFNFGPVIRKWISILYNDVQSEVMNGGYMTNYFKTSRGVRQGCPLSPFLFILSVELLALKIRHIPECKGITLPNSQEMKLSQFADDTTHVLSDIDSLKVRLLRIILTPSEKYQALKEMLQRQKLCGSHQRKGARIR